MDSLLTTVFFEMCISTSTTMVEVSSFGFLHPAVQTALPLKTGSYIS